MCLAANLHPKDENLAGIDLDAFSDLEGLDYQVSDDASLAVVAAPHCLGGERGAFPDTPAQVCDCSQSCTQMAQHGLSCLCLRIARSPTCVSVRKGACFLPIMMGNFT